MLISRRCRAEIFDDVAQPFKFSPPEANFSILPFLPQSNYAASYYNKTKRGTAAKQAPQL